MSERPRDAEHHPMPPPLTVTVPFTATTAYALVRVSCRITQSAMSLEFSQSHFGIKQDKAVDMNH